MNNIPTTRIDKKAIRAWQTTGLIFGLILVTVPVVLLPVFGDVLKVQMLIFWACIFLGAALYLIGILIIPTVRWQRWRYDITDDVIDLQRGLIILNRTLIPINRIQHVDTSQGPIYRRLGLSSVKISTAATTHEIPALDDDTAAVVRNKIAELVRKVKEDV